MNICCVSRNSICIAYNNIPGNTAFDVLSGAGFSAFIVFKGKRILFDTGADATILLNNIKALNIDARHLDAVLISHNHWDHVYGLPAVAAIAEQSPKIIVPASAADAIRQQNPRLEVISVGEPMEIWPGVWSTGSIDTSYREMPIAEQALILNGDDGLYVITGCAHVGIVNVIERAKQLLGEMPILLVAGGFHLGDASVQEIEYISSRLKQSGIRDIAPSHCTGHVAIDIFEKEWRDHHLHLYLGNMYYF